MKQNLQLQLTPDQIARLMFTVPEGSKLWCPECADRLLVESGAISDRPGSERRQRVLRGAMVYVNADWRCTVCNAAMELGCGWGQCPCCKQKTFATRNQWTYEAKCRCVQTPEQNRADERMAAEAKKLHDRLEGAVEVRQQARHQAMACLDTKPKRQCIIAEDRLPHPFCSACPRFDTTKKSPPPRAATPLSRVEWSERAGWTDKVPMQDVDDELYDTIQGM